MTAFDPACRNCPRLARFLDEVRKQHPTYFCRPVPPFGDPRPGLLIVGLAPGLHGANRTGRPFTGDHAGTLLYSTLHAFGFASLRDPMGADGAANARMKLKGCRISNAVKCLPPENKPTPAEIRTCNAYLAAELQDSSARVVLALGQIAHQAVLRALGLKLSSAAFAHGAEHRLPDGRMLIDSYHCSRYNTQTRRLTEEGFHGVFRQIRAHLDAPV